jgi:nucleoside-diphosphate-sugar epimerase
MKKQLTVFGGNGYLGKRMVKYALSKGIDVVSVSRSGAPFDSNDAAFVASDAKVSWLKGDLLNLNDTVKEELKKSHGAISCVGAFGSNEFMEKVNGDANVSAVEAAKEAGVSRFVYISTVENNLPDFLLKGYFNGKRRAEKAVMDTFTRDGTVLRPGFIYGTRQVPMSSSNLSIPLGLLGRPLQALFSTPPIAALRDILPGMKAILAVPLPVDWVAEVAVEAALEGVEESGSSEEGRVLTVQDIIREHKLLSKQ